MNFKFKSFIKAKKSLCIIIWNYTPNFNSITVTKLNSSILFKMLYSVKAAFYYT